MHARIKKNISQTSSPVQETPPHRCNPSQAERVFTTARGLLQKHRWILVAHAPNLSGEREAITHAALWSNQIRSDTRQRQYRCDLPTRWCSTEWGRSVRPRQAEHEGERNEKKIRLAILKREMTSSFSSHRWRDISLRVAIFFHAGESEANVRKLTHEIFALLWEIFLLKHFDVHHCNSRWSIWTVAPGASEKKIDRSDILATNLRLRAPLVIFYLPQLRYSASFMFTLIYWCVLAVWHFD